MSDTPEVDARQRIVLGGVGGDWKVVDADFARNIERQRNEARAELAQYRTAVQTLAENDFGSQGWNFACEKAAMMLRHLLKNHD